MLTRLLWLAPLLSVLTFYPTLTEQGCGGGEDPTPTPEPATDKARFDQYLEALRAATTSVERDALTADFFDTIQYSDGFPIIDGNTVTFVYEQVPGVNEPLRVSGVFNGWSASANPLQRAASGYHVWYTTVNLSDPHQRIMYKFVGVDDGGVDYWFADPTSRRFQYDSYGRYSLIFGGGSTEPSHLERYPLFNSSILGNERDLWLYLPPGYDQEQASLPVLYMHDGQNLFDPDAFYGGWKVDQVIDGLLGQGKMEEVMVVGMANTPDRMDEYTQVEDFLPAYGGWLGGEAEAYTRFVVEEVKPFIDARYRTRPERESTAVLGSSLGGLVSLYMGLAEPDVFSLVGGMSSTLGWGSINATNPTLIHDQQGVSKSPLKYYLDSGGDDGGGCIDSDNDGVMDDNPNADDNFCETAQFRDVLKAQGYTSSELLYVFGPGQEHNEASWNSRLHWVLTFFFPAS